MENARTAITSETIPKVLRRHFAQHNRRVFLVALFSIVSVLVFWAAIYFVVYWLVLLAISVCQGIDAQMPVRFLPRFLAAAAILCAIGLLARRLSPDDWAEDHRSAAKIAVDIVLAVPRATVAAFGTIAACQFLNERELGLAWRLLQAIRRERRIGIHALPLEIPDERSQRKIVLALQFAGLIDLRKIGDDFVFTFRDEAARALCQPPVRVSLG